MAERKTCYYEIMGVTRKATPEELKASFKKLSLKWHPDKNRHNIDEAKEKFKEINDAYQLLCDINKKSWYDAHREQILSGKDRESMTKEDMDMAAFGFNIWKYFQTSCYSGFEAEDEKGYYTVYREILEKIKYEEENAFEFNDEATGNYVSLPGFGDITYDTEKVKNFYQEWKGFTTYKTFAFADEYDPNEAANRYERRAIEKENKKLRAVERKAYIGTIRDLIQFIRKKDPRWAEIQNAVVKEASKIEEQKKAKELATEEAKKKLRQEVRMREMQRLDETAQYQMDIEDREELIKTIQDYYCEICDITFGSEKQFLNHKQSQKHHKNKERLLKEVATEYERSKYDSQKKESRPQEESEEDSPTKDLPRELTKEELEKAEERKQKQAKLADERKKKKNKKKANKNKKEEEEKLEEEKEESKKLEKEKSKQLLKNKYKQKNGEEKEEKVEEEANESEQDEEEEDQEQVDAQEEKNNLYKANKRKRQAEKKAAQKQAEAEALAAKYNKKEETKEFVYGVSESSSSEEVEKKEEQSTVEEAQTKNINSNEFIEVGEKKQNKQKKEDSNGAKTKKSTNFAKAH